MAFEGMGRNPHDRRREIDPRHRREPSTEELEDIQSKLEAWDRIKQTPVGEALYALAGPIMERADRMALASTDELLRQGCPIESHELIRAEARGAYWEWYRIVHEPLSLLKRLSELSGDKDAPSEPSDSDDVIEP